LVESTVNLQSADVRAKIANRTFDEADRASEGKDGAKLEHRCRHST
jgi:hypothetical protein